MGQANEVRVETYRVFVDEGRAPTVGELTGTLGLSDEEVRASLRELAVEDVIAFRPGTEDLWLVHPFCAVDAPFSVRAGRRQWQAICIWDALGILALVGSDGEVTTRCPDCGELLQIRIEDGMVHGPPQAVVHFGVPASRWYEDVGYT